MTNQHIANTIKELGLMLGASLEEALFEDLFVNSKHYGLDEAFDFKRDLTESAQKVRLILLDQKLKSGELVSFIRHVEIPVVAFVQEGSTFYPVILNRGKRGTIVAQRVHEQSLEETDFDKINHRFILDQHGEVILMGAFSYRSLVSEHAEGDQVQPLSPVKRLFRLLGEERKDIFYVFVYAAFVGLVSLTLPLGIQATVELVSGGVVVSSIYLLIFLVLLGVLASGGLQIMQITMVEYIQRRVFTKAALEFTFRIPRMKIESLNNLHAPELINRFFDVLTIQKGLPKLLGDLISGVIQILFGLLLLSFYHPFFVFFGLVLMVTLIVIFRMTGPKGLQSSIKESKYKYQVVYWLEEIARTMKSFKISGNSNLPVKKTEYNVNNYLVNRKAHFKVLMSQYFYIILFKAVITGGLLIIGTSLVINREITLGQFVAAEVIIILILNSVEKLVTYMDVVYDMLTAVDKISQVTDLPLEKVGGINLKNEEPDKGFSVKIRNLSYTYPGSKNPAIKHINTSFESGEKVCIAGGNDSGKTTLTNTVAGINQHYEGSITINGFSVRDLDLTNLRDKLAKNVSEEDIFEGTILENIIVGKPMLTTSDAVAAIAKVGLSEVINSLPDGMSTRMLSGGKGFSGSFVHKLILARCLVKKPRLMILNDFFGTFHRSEKEKLIQTVKEESQCTLIMVSNDPPVMEAADRVIVLKNGGILAEGTYAELLRAGRLNKIMNI